MTDERNEFLESFGEPISVYTEAEAIEDGTLVDVGSGDRMTRAVFEFLSEKLPDKPVGGWPVDLMAFISANRKKDDGARAIAAARGLISVNREEAKRIYEHNIGGGIMTFYAEVGPNGKIKALHKEGEAVESSNVHKLWLIPNEEGVTLLEPSDY